MKGGENVKRNLNDELFRAGQQLWVAIANEKNGGEPVFRSTRSGRPMTGRYCGEYAKWLRNLVKQCQKRDEFDNSLAVLLADLEGQIGWIKAGQPSSRPEGYLQERQSLSHAEKIRRCNEALDYLDGYFAVA
jgi:hypothetical protein